MKRTVNSLLKHFFYALAVLFSTLLTAEAQVQTPKSNAEFLFHGSDSLAGFDAQAAWSQLISNGIDTREAAGHVEFLKRNYIRARYFPAVTNQPIAGKFTNTTAVVNGSPCVNEGFESTPPAMYTTSNSVTGWTLSSMVRTFDCIPQTASWTPGSSDFFIRATPITGVPGMGTLPHSPLGGTVVAQLNDNLTSDYSITRLAQTFPVTNSNSLFRFAFAAVLQQAAGHSCCQEPAFRMVVRNCAGQELSCQSMSVTGTNSCSAAPVTFTASGLAYWTSWQVKQIDLSPFIGSCVTVEFIALDCSFGGHYGMVYLDTECGSQTNSLPCANCVNYYPLNPVNYCPGGPAQLTAPQGYATYQWISPITGTLNAPSSTMTAITITNPIPGATYTAVLSTNIYCQYLAIYTLATTQVSINAIGASGSCSTGASGSATVVTSGSGSGYSYAWVNSSNSVVATSPVANNLPQGNYTVMVSALNNTNCGTAAATINVGVHVPTPQQILKPFCGGVAVLNTPPGTGHQWYLGSSLVSTTAVFVPTNPAQSQLYRVGYTTPQGCRDSIIYGIYAASPGTVAVIQNPTVCASLANGQALVSLTPVGPSVTGIPNTFTVISTGNTPSFSFTGSASVYTMGVPGLSGGGSYSITAFDGSCFTGATFTTHTFNGPNTFSVVPAWSPTVCQGTSVPVNIYFSSSVTPGQYTYSWSPSTGLSSTTGINALVTPSAAPGTSAVTVYSISVSPTLTFCPVTKTISVLVSNPATPTITSPGMICSNQNPFQVSVTPPGGTVAAPLNSGLNSSGWLNPSVAIPGAYTFSYQTAMNNCIAHSTSSFTIAQGPTLSVTGNTSICSGNSTTLTATGAQMYLWPGFGTGPQVVVSPANTTSYVVTGSSGNGCNASQMVIVMVTPTPSLSVTGNAPICTDESLTLTASGADLFVWSNGSVTPQIIISPSVSATYTVFGTNLPANCVTHQTLQVLVHPSPAVHVTHPPQVCKGDQVLMQAAGGQSYQWNGMPGGAVYTTTLYMSTTFTVTSFDQNGCSYDVIVTIPVDECTGLADMTGDRARIYPVPSTDHLYIDLPSAAGIVLYDASGKLLLKKQLPAGVQSVDMRHFSEGIYYLRIVSVHESTIKKVIRQYK